MGKGKRNYSLTRVRELAPLSFHRGISRKLQGPKEDSGNKMMFSQLCNLVPSPLTSKLGLLYTHL